MNEQEQKEYLEKYSSAKKKGVPFFPDILFKDGVAALLVFIILVGLAIFVGAPLEERANPADASYTPRPEWYFMFLFQLLKYFPGELEVLGVVVLPTIAIVLLFLLPFLDRSAKRHFSRRPWVTAITTLSVLGIIFLTVQAIREAPPPVEAAGGDATAALYAENCAGCHGPSMTVPVTADLHAIILEGSHEGMPAWSADLTNDEIDALTGFILSPAGSQLFTEQCGECHEAVELVALGPAELKQALDLGAGYPAHNEVDVPNWRDTLTREEAATLLNFLSAPDGRRLFATNCSSCHGNAVRFDGDAAELRDVIVEGGLHIEMPPWREKLSEEEILILAQHSVDPAGTPEGDALFEQNCERCHGQRIPSAASVAEAEEIIATGGSHETMPVWGDILTDEQIEALVAYTIEASEGTPQAIGGQLFIDNCADCHGELGEGGENPALPGDVIAPISTAEYLKTRDDFTLESIISQGQPNFGMSPFGSAYGGPLDDDEIGALVSYLRSWEANPPVDLPPEIHAETLSLQGFEIYSEICAQCHGFTGQGDLGPSLRDPDFRESSSQDIFDTISEGHDATDMIAWGSILSSEQILQLVNFIEQLPIDERAPEPPPEEAAAEEPADEEVVAVPTEEAPPEEVVISFMADIMPLFEYRCIDCHGTEGGWDASTYDLVMESGDNAPVIIPGDPENSLLYMKLTGTHEEGDSMPPPPLRALKDEQIELIFEWIAAGAMDN